MSAVPAPQRPHVPIESWPDALEATVASACTLLRTVIVLRETASTQDHARATSLARLGIHTDRLAVLDALTRSVDIAFQEPIESIYRTYCTLDRLTGRSCAFNTPDGSVTGMVRSVDPRLGIQVETASGVLFLPSATTSVVPAHAGSRYGGADVSR